MVASATFSSKKFFKAECSAESWFMIAVIIPTLNEAELLPETLDSIRANDTACEMVVVDGGSRDKTVQLAEAGGARVIHSPRRQRAFQMNLGVQQARSDIF